MKQFWISQDQWPFLTQFSILSILFFNPTSSSGFFLLLVPLARYSRFSSRWPFILLCQSLFFCFFFASTLFSVLFFLLFFFTTSNYVPTVSPTFNGLGASFISYYRSLYRSLSVLFLRPVFFVFFSITFFFGSLFQVSFRSFFFFVTLFRDSSSFLN